MNPWTNVTPASVSSSLADTVRTLKLSRLLELNLSFIYLSAVRPMAHNAPGYLVDH